MPIHDPHSYANLEQGKIGHIDLSLNIDFERRQLSGKASYKFDRPINGSFNLDTRNLEIEGVEIAGRPVAWTLGEEHPLLGQELKLEGLAGSDHVTIGFTTLPESRALQWFEPEQTAGKAHPFLYSQCQALNARSIFPCQDTPSVRFTYTAQVDIEQPLMVVMAAAAEGAKEHDGRTTYSFKMPQRIPSYLFALAAGNLTSREIGPRCRVYAEPEQVEEVAWEFADTERRLEEAETLFGPYPWERYDLLMLPPSYPFGGMENPRLTFLTPTLLVGDRSQVNVVVHEMAHSWTGNLVTNATWQDFWLNEGWTVYAEQRIMEAIEGQDYAHLLAAHWIDIMLGQMQQIGMDSKATLLKQDPADGVDPTDALTWVPYYKGFSFLKRLEEAVGRPAFDEFIRKYIDRFKFSALTTEQFLDFLKVELPAAAAEVDLDQWIYQPGFPDDAPRLTSPLLENVDQWVTAFQDGRLPGKEEVASWNQYQVMRYLNQIPAVTSVDICHRLDTLFKLPESRNAQSLSAFLALSIRSGDEAILPRVEAFVEQVGRLILILPVFRALAQSDWSRELARPLFEQVRSHHHVITQSIIERTLSAEGL